MWGNSRSNEQGNSEEQTGSRRSFLRGVGATATAATGMAAMSGTAAATTEVQAVQSDDPQDSFPEEAELLVYVHGWLGDTDNIVSDGPVEQASSLVDNIAKGGYEADANVAFSWPATTGYLNAEYQRMPEAAENLATKIEQWQDSISGTGNLRLIGHSLGVDLVLNAVENLDWGYEVESVVTLAGSENYDNVCLGALELNRRVVNFRNYYSFQDYFARFNTGRDILGREGLDGKCYIAPWDDVDTSYSRTVSERFWGVYEDEHFKYLYQPSIGKNIGHHFAGDDPTDVIDSDT